MAAAPNLSIVGKLLAKLPQVKKAVVAVVGAAAEAAALGVLPPSAAKWVSVAVAIATAVGVYGAKNAPAA